MRQVVQEQGLDSCPWAAAENGLGPIPAGRQKHHSCLGFSSQVLVTLGFSLHCTEDDENRSQKLVKMSKDRSKNPSKDKAAKRRKVNILNVLLCCVNLKWIELMLMEKQPKSHEFLYAFLKSHSGKFFETGSFYSVVLVLTNTDWIGQKRTGWESMPFLCIPEAVGQNHCLVHLRILRHSSPQGYRASRS